MCDGMGKGGGWCAVVGGARALVVVCLSMRLRFWAAKPNEPNHELAHPWVLGEGHRLHRSVWAGWRPACASPVTAF